MDRTQRKLSRMLDPIAEVPTTWRTVRLGEIGRFLKGKGIVKNDLSTAGVPCIRYADVYTKYNNVADTSNSFVPPGLGTPLRTGDLVFTSSGEDAGRDRQGHCVVGALDRLS